MSKTNLRIRSIIVVAGLLLILGLFLSVRSLSLGSDFGNETSIILETDDVNSVLECMTNELGHSENIKVKALNDKIYLFELVGIGSLDDFEYSFNQSLPNTQILSIGTFGSQTNYNNNVSFIHTSLMCLFILMVIFFVFKYQYTGFIVILPYLTASLGSLVMMNVLGIQFTYLIWLFFWIVTCGYIFMTYNFINQYTGQNIIEKIQDMKTINTFLVNYGSRAVILIMAGFGLIYVMEQTFYTVGLVTIIYSSTMVISIILLVSFIRYITRQFSEINEILLPNNKLLRLNIPTNTTYKFYLRTIIVGLVSILIYGIFYQPEIMYDSSYNAQQILIMNSMKEVDYIELQADLIHYDIANYQESYSVSEQGQIWIYFNEQANYTDLQQVAHAFMNRMNIDLDVYYIPPETVPLTVLKVILFEIVFFLGNMVVVHSNPHTRYFAFLVGLISIAIYLLIIVLLRIKIDDYLILNITLFPTTILTYYTFYNGSNKKKDVNQLVYLSIMAWLITAVPALVTMPNQITFKIVFEFTLSLFAILSGIFLIRLK